MFTLNSFSHNTCFSTLLVRQVSSNHIYKWLVNYWLEYLRPLIFRNFRNFALKVFLWKRISKSEHRTVSYFLVILVERLGLIKRHNFIYVQNTPIGFAVLRNVEVTLINRIGKPQPWSEGFPRDIAPRTPNKCCRTK